MPDDGFRQRGLATALRDASARFPVVFVTGPRQTGKTTLLRHLSEPSRRYVTLDDPAARELASRDPALFFQAHPPPILIDEVQYAPGLLPYVKMRADQGGAPGMFWLTGSQHFHAMRDIGETLAGRVALLRLLGFGWRETWSTGVDLPPFLPTRARIDERGSADPPFDLESLAEAIWTGGYPRLCIEDPPDRDVFFASYVQTWLQRDVRDLLQVGDLSAFDRFVRACAARTGQLLNLSNLARDVDISVPTAKSWLSVLEATMVVHLLPAWHSNRTKRLVKAPKLYFLDTGLCCYLTGWTSPRAAIEGAAAGALVETWALGEILKSWWARGREAPIHHLRTDDGVEIDFVLELDGAMHGIEVKRAATVRAEAWLKPFRTLDRLGVPRGEGAVLCLVPDELPLDDRTRALPFGVL